MNNCSNNTLGCSGESEHWCYKHLKHCSNCDFPRNWNCSCSCHEEHYNQFVAINGDKCPCKCHEKFTYKSHGACCIFEAGKRAALEAALAKIAGETEDTHCIRHSKTEYDCLFCVEYASRGVALDDIATYLKGELDK